MFTAFLSTHRVLRVKINENIKLTTGIDSILSIGDAKSILFWRDVVKYTNSAKSGRCVRSIDQVGVSTRVDILPFPSDFTVPRFKHDKQLQ